jgi:phage host-nuclease inhibitor protein Gam
MKRQTGKDEVMRKKKETGKEKGVNDKKDVIAIGGIKKRAVYSDFFIRAMGVDN